MTGIKLSLITVYKGCASGVSPLFVLRRTMFRSQAMHAHPHHYEHLNSLVDRVALIAGQIAMLAALPVAAFTILVGPI
jgi:hypothetical protein